MASQKFEILKAHYDKKDDAVELTVNDFIKPENVKWVLNGDNFDNLINEWSGNNFSYSPSQRVTLCKSLAGNTFYHDPKNDKNTNVSREDLKEENATSLKKFDKAFADYPFQHIMSMTKDDD